MCCAGRSRFRSPVTNLTKEIVWADWRQSADPRTSRKARKTCSPCFNSIVELRISKRQGFTGPQKRCSGPTRIFNTGDRGVARRPRAALHSGPANEALSGSASGAGAPSRSRSRSGLLGIRDDVVVALAGRRRGAREVRSRRLRSRLELFEEPRGVPRSRSPRRPRHLRRHRNQTPVFYRAPKGVLRSHQDFQYGRSRRECL